MSEELNNKRTVEEVSDGADTISKKIKTTETTGIQEADVGITHFLSEELPGFKGQIKQRFTDFLVNEISKDGNVVHLNDKGFNMPKKKQPSAEQKKADEEAEAKMRKDFKVDPETRLQLVDILGEEDVAKIEDVYRNVVKMETSKSFDDKATRTKIHQLIRTAFDNQLESVTSESNTFQIATANRKSRVNKRVLSEQNKDENGVENWGYGPASDFIHFTMYKENKDTMDVANILSKYLRTPTRMIRFSGTKDRRAVTCQRMSISKISLERLNALNRVLKGVVIGGFKYENYSLNLGDLEGNEFTIGIRDVEIAPTCSMKLEEILEKGCSSLSKNGFINYFGMQRFGTFSVSTHEIGKEVLMGNWKRAAELILAEQESVLPKSKEARAIWAETKDPVAALRKMPRQCVAENAILNALSNQPKSEDGDYSDNSYYNGITKIPRNLRTMYAHAYQSYIWNIIASKRIELFGLEIVPGDLILDSSAAAAAPVHEEAAEKDDIPDDEFAEDLRDAQFVRARPVTQEEVESGKYSIDDVVLPTPGFDIIYPTNETLRQLYVSVMAKDSMDPFDMRRKVRDFSLAGSYRNVIHKPKDLEYRVVHYNTPTQQLINTDLEILNNKRGRDNGQKYMKDKLERFPQDKGGEKTAVLLKFKLGVSAYATMALRELMKLETSRRGDMCDVKN